MNAAAFYNFFRTFFSFFIFNAKVINHISVKKCIFIKVSGRIRGFLILTRAGLIGLYPQKIFWLKKI